MVDKILLNSEPLTIKESNLPCLITYGEGMGGSHLSVTIVANLFLQGSKLLFLTAYPMAKDNFLQQVGNNGPSIAFVNTIEELEKAIKAQAIILESGNESLFLEVTKLLPDLNQRIILVKNMEVFSKPVIDYCLDKDKVVLSGNIDNCESKEVVAKKKYETIIAFNQPTIKLPITIPVPTLEKYKGYFSGSGSSGIISVQKTQSAVQE